MIAATTAPEGSHPTNVDTTEQLEGLPEEYLSDDPRRPLLYTDTYCGSKYKYALKPLFYSTVFILLIEGLERFSYYGIVNTQTPYLVGQYDPDWNANMTSVQASSYVSGSTAIAYSMPFVGGVIADGFMGDYWTVVFGTSILYFPGLLLLALTTIPYLLGPAFSQSALTASMLVLYPMGAGFIKSVVNVFGAKQYHPVLQTDMIEAYYVNFYMAINVGALVGGIMIPLIAQSNVTAAYMIPVGALMLGLLCFLLGTSRYVRVTPRKDVLFKTFQVIGSPLVCKAPGARKKSRGGTMDDSFVEGVKLLLAVIPITALTIPFNIAYSQMITVFSVQGMAMRNAAFFDSAMMLNFDALSVLIFGFLVGSYLYPYLSKRNIHLAITHKFAIGTFLGGLAIVAALAVDYAIHSHANQISIMWQIFQYLLIGMGEIFAVAAAYETAFVVAPKEQKGLASAINLFLIGGVPNYICISLYNACANWFPVDVDLATYQTSQVYDYLWVLVGISVFGVLLCVFPPIKNWVEGIHRQALELNAVDQKESALSLDDAEKQPSTKQLDQESDTQDKVLDVEQDDEQDDEMK